MKKKSQKEKNNSGVKLIELQPIFQIFFFRILRTVNIFHETDVFRLPTKGFKNVKIKMYLVKFASS